MSLFAITEGRAAKVNEAPESPHFCLIHPLKRNDDPSNGQKQTNVRHQSDKGGFSSKGMMTLQMVKRGSTTVDVPSKVE
jgi:hypothetical protein